MKNVVQLGNTSEMKAMLNNIEDNGKGGLIAINNREYSGSFTLYGVRNIKKGPIGDPRKGNKLPSYGNSQFHSNPSGKIKENGNICSWQQPPSKQDINAVKDKTNEYVVGMGSKLIYKYNSKGVFAVIPMSIFINIYD